MVDWCLDELLQPTPFEKYTQPPAMKSLTCPDCGEKYKAVCHITCPQCQTCVFIYMSLLQKEW